MLTPGLNAALHDGEIDGGDVTKGEGGVGRQPLPLLLPQRHQLVQHVVRLNPSRIVVAYQAFYFDCKIRNGPKDVKVHNQTPPS